MSKATHAYSTPAPIVRALSLFGQFLAGMTIVCGGSVAVAFATLI